MSLAVTPGGSSPLTLTAMVLGLGLRQRLGGQHVLDLGGADAEGDRAERAVGGGVRVAADHRHAGLGQAELRADDVHDALVEIAEAVDPDAELLGVAAQGVDLGPRHRVGDRLVDVRASGCCGPRWPSSGRGDGPGDRPGADRRRPAGWSPRAPGAGRCRAGRAHPRPSARRVRPRSSRSASSAWPSSPRSSVAVSAQPGRCHRSPVTVVDLHSNIRDGSIKAWTTLAVSACWTKPRSC